MTRPPSCSFRNWVCRRIRATTCSINRRCWPGHSKPCRPCGSASEVLALITVVGLPLQVDHVLFNCAVVLYRGRILGVVPKTFLPNYREFYELRQFAPAAAASTQYHSPVWPARHAVWRTLAVSTAPDSPFTFFVEICEDLWVPIPPSCYAALAGATVLLNLSASNITIGKEEYRHSLVSNQSARCLAAYLYTAAGHWGIHHRPGLGRPCHHLRKRHTAGRITALPGRLTAGAGRP